MHRSITTDGHILTQPLAKAQCADCGMLRRQLGFDRPLPDFYSNDYAFYARPGAESFDAARYRDMARWVLAAIGGFAPRHIAEVGCGNGWTLRAMRDLYPEARYTGIEPSQQAGRVAQASGLSVIPAAVGMDTLPAGTRFDLVYSNNVIEHTADPINFLRSLKTMLQPGGRIVISCPNGTHAAADMMFADHLFTFAPGHLVRLFRQTELVPLVWSECPTGLGLRNEQLVAAALDDSERLMPQDVEVTLPVWDAAVMLRERVEYLSRWRMLDGYFHETLGEAKHIYHFGAGEWGFLLAGYAPETWSRIEACTVDGHEGNFMGKEVLAYETLQNRSVDAIIVGTNPGVQLGLAQRLEQQGYRAITWQHLVAQ